MTIDKLRDLHQARPFQPFVIYLADGRNFPVVHPEFLSMSPKERTIVVHLPDSSMKILDLLLVTSLGPVNERQRHRGRGKRRK
jgi:hypothetical protein